MLESPFSRTKTRCLKFYKQNGGSKGRNACTTTTTTTATILRVPRRQNPPQALAKMAETLDPKITKTAARLFAVLQKEQLYWRGGWAHFGKGKGRGQR